ncbi:MAG: hypothetical protein Kow0090_02640 [Myxococcota bacterium]
MVQEFVEKSENSTNVAREPNSIESGDKEKALKIDRFFFLGISLVTLFVIFYETTAFQALMFISNYMNSIMILSIALLGISVGGVIAFALRRRAGALLFSISALALPFFVLISFAFLCLFPDAPWIYSVALMLPFIPASVIISIAFSLAPSHKIYFYDLSGAALGAVAVCISVPFFREEGSFMLIMAVGFVALLIFARGIHGKWQKRFKLAAVSGLLLLLVIFITNLGFDYVNMIWLVRESRDSDKIFSAWHRYNDPERKKPRSSLNKYFKPRYSRGSLVERIDIVKSNNSRYRTFYNGYGNDHISSTPPKGFKKDRRIARGLVEDPDVLVVGTAAEGVVKTAKALGEGKVVGVEINPAIADIMLDDFMYKWSRKAYQGIELHILDVRSYLKKTDRKFHIITMMNTHRLRNIGYAGQPEYLHTVEALKDIFDHLHPNGWLILEERDINNQARLGIKRFIHNVKYVLKNELKSADPSKHFWIYDWYGRTATNRENLYTQIYIKKTPINEDDLKFIDEWTAMQKANPRLKANGAVLPRFVPGKKTNHEIEKFILTDDPYKMYNSKTYNFDIITDDRPFPYDVYRERAHLRSIMKPSVILTLSLGLLPVILLLIIGKVIKKRREEEIKSGGAIFSSSTVLYFALLGVGYLVLEVVLIQYLQIFIGMPVLTMAVVIAGMLFFSGLGSYFSDGWRNNRKLMVFGGIVAYGLLLFASIRWIIDNLIFLPLFLKILLVLVMLFPLSFLMGVPFPFGMNRVKERLGERFAAAMFGLNGAFSALATPLALTLATVYGYKATFLTGITVYAFCFLLALILLLPHSDKAAGGGGA